MLERTYEMPDFANEQLDLIELRTTNPKIPGEVNEAHALVDGLKYKVDIYPEDRHVLTQAGYDVTPGECHIPIITAVDGRRIASVIDKDGEYWPVNRRERARYATNGKLATMPAEEPNITAFPQPQTAGQSGLFAKMAKVMGKLRRIPKSGTNTHFDYPYVTEADIADAVRTALAECGIAFFTEIVEFSRIDGVRKKTYNDKVYEKPFTMTRVKMRFTFACADTGQTIDRYWFGEAEDDSDKGISKAVTLAQKYFLKTTFVISTGDPADDPDSGQSSDGADSKPQKKSGLSKRAVPPASQAPTAPQAAPENANDAPADVMKFLMNDKSVQKAWKTSQEGRNTINAMWREGALTADMEQADMVLSVIERLAARQKDGAK